MSPEILRLKTFAGLSFAAIAIIAAGMAIGMLKSDNGQSVLAFFTGGIGGVSTVISLWANPSNSGKHSDQVNLSSGLQVNVADPAAESAQEFSESEPQILR
jgi:hypothetical protein